MALFQLPIILLILPKREVLVLPSPFRLAVANVLLSHVDPPSIAHCMGMGVKIYSGSEWRCPAPDSPITRSPPAATVKQAWLVHSQAAREMVSQGRTMTQAASFRLYVEWSGREEDLSQYV